MYDPFWYNVGAMNARDVLFSKTQQRLIRILYSREAAEGLSYVEIVRQTAGGSGAIHRELTQFQSAGLIEIRGNARRRVYAPNKRHPVYPELWAIAEKLLRNSAAIAASRESLAPGLAKQLAKKYLWWMKPRDVLKDEDRLVAQVMNMGTLEDARLVEKTLGDARLRRVVRNARPGQFEAKSWTYWHYRLNLSAPGHVPPLPVRRFA